MNESTELAEIRHGLKNFLTAMRSGCMLIESEVAKDSHPIVHEFLKEMRAELENGKALVERLSHLDTTAK